MYFLDNITAPLQPVELTPCSTRLFVEGAVKALKGTNKAQHDIILRDLAEHVGCDPLALNFMIDTANIHDDETHECQITMPNFRKSLDII